MRCTLDASIRDGARCARDACRGCGWNAKVQEKRLAQIHAGKLAVDEEGRKYLPVEPLMPVSAQKGSDEERMAAYLEGLTDKQIAIRFDCSASVIYAWRKKHGLAANGGKK